MLGKSIGIVVLAVALITGPYFWLMAHAASGIPAAAPAVVASTTTTATAGVSPIYSPTTGYVIGFAPSSQATLFGNADIDGDGINDIVMVVVDAPLPPPSTTPARYRVYVTNGAWGYTMHNISLVSPTWYSPGNPY